MINCTITPDSQRTFAVCLNLGSRIHESGLPLPPQEIYGGKNRIFAGYSAQSFLQSVIQLDPFQRANTNFGKPAYLYCTISY